VWAEKQPQFASKYLKKVIKRTSGFYHPLECEIPKTNKPNVLLVIGLCAGELNILASLPGWRQKFDIVVAYVFDAWHFDYYPKYIREIDHLFVPMPEIIDTLHQKFKIPVSLLSFGVDALTQGWGGNNRPFDLISYGRIPQQYHQAFHRRFNKPHSGRIYYRFTPRPPELFPANAYENRRDQEDRMVLFHILRQTKLALAFDTVYPGMRQFPHPFVTLRWFECGAAGCGIIGKRPTTPVVDELLNWEDSTIELPEDPQESVEIVEQLLQDQNRLNSIHRRNYLENLAKHDWRHRIQLMLETLNLSLPPRLVEELSQIKELSKAEVKQIVNV
jgi:hypothetical protein